MDGDAGVVHDNGESSVLEGEDEEGDVFERETAYCGVGRGEHAGYGQRRGRGRRRRQRWGTWRSLIHLRRERQTP